MLTRTDLKSIDTLLDKKFDVKLKPIEKKLTNLEITTRTIQKDLKQTSNFLDKESLKTVKRVRIIEEHLGFPQPAII